jgi:hypothetical protein
MRRGAPVTAGIRGAVWSVTMGQVRRALPRSSHHGGLTAHR